jgi:hypothetical protein
LKSLRLPLLLLILASPLAAQHTDYNKLSSEPLTLVPVPGAPVPAPAKPAKTVDKKFLAMMGSLGGAESFRLTSRQMVVEREFEAGAPWITSVPTNQHIIPKHLALFGAEFGVAYEMKKPHAWLPGDRILRKMWWAYAAAMSAIHIKNAVGNVRTQGPGGCTSIACAEQQMQ